MKKILQGMMNTMNSVKPPRMTALRELHEAETGGPFSILIGTILSARTKDESTTKVVKILFSEYKNAKDLANAKLKDIEKIIRPIGFYHVKAKRIIEVAKIIDSKYKGRVPDNLEKLVELPGVGRKTANCVLVYAFDKPAIPVDIHVHRISNRLGLALRALTFKAGRFPPIAALFVVRCACTALSSRLALEQNRLSHSTN